MITCTKCKRELNEDEFVKCKSTISGYTNRCKQCRKEYYQHYYTKFPEKKRLHAEKQKLAHQKQQAIINERYRKKWRKDRESCLLKYGGKCACCGEYRYEFLAIDHINGGGNQERKKLSRNGFIKFLIKNNFPSGYRVLCHNCNMSIGFYGYCPHQKNV